MMPVGFWFLAAQFLADFLEKSMEYWFYALAAPCCDLPTY